MANTELVAVAGSDVTSTKNVSTKQFVTMVVDGQLFGIPVLTVQDILRPQPIAAIPLSQPEILGSINLRGRIVTVINMHRRLGVAEHKNPYDCMHIVVDYKDEQYSFIVDRVGEVLNLSLSDFEKNPANLKSNWQDLSLGVYRLDGEIMIVLDIDSLLKF